MRGTTRHLISTLSYILMVPAISAPVGRQNTSYHQTCKRKEKYNRIPDWSHYTLHRVLRYSREQGTGGLSSTVSSLYTRTLLVRYDRSFLTCANFYTFFNQYATGWVTVRLAARSKKNKRMYLKASNLSEE